jgi:hypothetical protein
MRGTPGMEVGQGALSKEEPREDRSRKNWSIASPTRPGHQVVAKEVIQHFLNAIIDELSGEPSRVPRVRRSPVARARGSAGAESAQRRSRCWRPAKRIVKFKVGRLMRKKVSGYDVGDLTLDDDDDDDEGAACSEVAQEQSESRGPNGKEAEGPA